MVQLGSVYPNSFQFKLEIGDSKVALVTSSNASVPFDSGWALASFSMFVFFLLKKYPFTSDKGRSRYYTPLVQ